MACYLLVFLPACLQWELCLCLPLPLVRFIYSVIEFAGVAVVCLLCVFLQAGIGSVKVGPGERELQHIVIAFSDKKKCFLGLIPHNNVRSICVCGTEGLHV